MNSSAYITSACRYCRFYNPEGRRGGMCSQLNVLVKSHWKSCQFASPVFQRDWQTIPEIAILEKSFSLGCATPSTNLEVEAQKISQKRQNTTEKEEIISP